MIKVFSLITTILCILTLLFNTTFDLNTLILAVFSGGIFVQELTIDKLLRKIKDLESNVRNVN